MLFCLHSFRDAGAHRVAPGQITDDTEMGLCLAQALSEQPQFRADAHAVWYKYAEVIRQKAE